VNVLSLSGLPGIGENVVTWGLGPAAAPSPPVPPFPSPAGGGAITSPTPVTGAAWAYVRPPYFEHELFDPRRKKKKEEEQKRDRERQQREQERPREDEFIEPDIGSGEIEKAPDSAPEPTEEPSADVDYAILPIGEFGRVRALADGVVTYVDGKNGPGAAVHGDDGVRYLYAGVVRVLGGPEEGQRVKSGDTIGRSTGRTASKQVAYAQLPPAPAPEESKTAVGALPAPSPAPVQAPAPPVAPPQAPAVVVAPAPAIEPWKAALALGGVVALVWWLSTRKGRPAPRKPPAKKAPKRRKAKKRARRR
jgi:hypothetical protein